MPEIEKKKKIKITNFSIDAFVEEDVIKPSNKPLINSEEEISL